MKLFQFFSCQEKVCINDDDHFSDFILDMIMNSSWFLCITSGILLYVNLVYTSTVTSWCHCTCCVMTKPEMCKRTQAIAILSEIDHCQTNTCRNFCRQYHTRCDLHKEIIDGVCLPSVQ